VQTLVRPSIFRELRGEYRHLSYPRRARDTQGRHKVFFLGREKHSGAQG
jgi:hypothetical protein